MLPAAAGPPPTEDIAPLFGGNAVVGARIGEGAGAIYTDFRIHGDGSSRFLVFDVRLTSRQAGRMLQRMLEIETYVMQALLTYPLARAGCAGDRARRLACAVPRHPADRALLPIPEATREPGINQYRVGT